MGATNTTTHYNLSQFVSTDKPAWLQDYNGDMLKIDTAIDAAKVAADTAQTTANAASGASTQNANDIAALSVDVSGQGANITALQLAVNTINSLIGNGTPTTTDQTIIGAINEINNDLTALEGNVLKHKYAKIYKTGINVSNQFANTGFYSGSATVAFDDPIVGTIRCVNATFVDEGKTVILTSVTDVTNNYINFSVLKGSSNSNLSGNLYIDIVYE